MRPRVRPIISDATIRRVQKAAVRWDELLAELTNLPCPLCGRLSLAQNKELAGIVVYCERSVCSWKPFTKAF